MTATATTTAATTTPATARPLKAGVVIPGDVIELGGQPWRVTAGETHERTRTLVLKHAQLPNRRRTIRPRRERLILVLNWDR